MIAPGDLEGFFSGKGGAEFLAGDHEDSEVETQEIRKGRRERYDTVGVLSRVGRNKWHTKNNNI